MSSECSIPLWIVVSAPSGAGKTTLCERLRKSHPGMRYSVSCTTRPPRPGEQDGVHYTFLLESDFLKRVADSAFLEYARVHGHWYGTLREPVESALQSGCDVLMDIDVQGAAQIREALIPLPKDHRLRRAYIDVFISPPSIEELRRRLTSRGQDSAEVIERRLAQAESEMARAGEYQFQIVNDDLDRASEALIAWVRSERQRR
ncbi:MAG: guanylate kinase, partial [Kiritimatiellia bacterium]|nr:guanylate kinase [Kiritimatiellia bacterium]